MALLRRYPDLFALASLLAGFVVLAVLTWRTWGNPQVDAGAELTTAERIAHGELPYADVRYFYGPLGLYALVLAFKLFGASLATAYGFGLAQALAIVIAFFVLARQWLRPPAALVASAVVLAIAFAGNLFSFVLPHTNSATFGLLFLLLELLALARGKPVFGGLAAGCVALTRPEFAAAAMVAAAGYLLGTYREKGWRTTGRVGARIAIPALAIAGPVLAFFAAEAGLSRLFFENLVPLDFVRVSGLSFMSDWAPFTPASFVALAGKACVYVTLLGALVASSVRLSRARGPAARVRALWPLAAACFGLLVAAAALKLIGAFPGSRGAVQTEVRHLMIGISWLPALAIALTLVAVRHARQRDPGPLSGRWPADLALLGAALVLGLRAYNDFTPEIYAAYYAAPLVLLAGILHQRLADRWPSARLAVLGALGLVAAAMAYIALTGAAADETRLVRTPRGSFMAEPERGLALERVITVVRERTRDGDLVLGLPLEGGLPFLADRRPALYDIQLLPGSLESRTDEREAIRRLEEERVPIVVEGNSRFAQWGYPAFGRDFNRLLHAHIERAYRRIAEVGDFEASARGARSDGARAYRIWERR
jgi:hypothetical protein